MYFPQKKYQVFNKHLLTWIQLQGLERLQDLQPLSVLYGRQMKGRELSHDPWPNPCHYVSPICVWHVAPTHCQGSWNWTEGKRLWEWRWGLTWGTSASASSGSAWWAVQTLGTGLSPRTGLWLVSYWAQGGERKKITLRLVQPWCQEARERQSTARPWVLLLSYSLYPPNTPPCCTAGRRHAASQASPPL